MPDDDIKVEDLEVKEEEKKDAVEEVEESSVEETEEVKETEEESTEEFLEEDSEPINLRPSVKEVLKEFPELFKKFPEMRTIYFREQELSKLFSTIDEAKEAAERLEGLSALEEQLTSGSLEDTEKIISSIKDVGEDSLNNYSINFLPALRKVDVNAYYRVITPELATFVRSLYDAGVRLGDKAGENQRNAAMVASLYLFQDKDIATGKSTLNLPGPKEVKKEDHSEVENERAKFKVERFESLFQDVVSEYEDRIGRLIQEELDPDEVMSPYMKKVLTRDIIKEIDSALLSDRSHKNNMAVIWKQAGSSNFNSSWKAKILSAVLARAKTIMPSIRSKVRSEALGTSERVSKKMVDTSKISKTKNVGHGSSNGNPVRTDITRIDPKKIDRSMSDLDILQGKPLILKKE